MEALRVVTLWTCTQRTQEGRLSLGEDHQLYQPGAILSVQCFSAHSRLLVQRVGLEVMGHDQGHGKGHVSAGKRCNP